MKTAVAEIPLMKKKVSEIWPVLDEKSKGRTFDSFGFIPDYGLGWAGIETPSAGFWNNMIEHEARKKYAEIRIPDYGYNMGDKDDRLKGWSNLREHDLRVRETHEKSRQERKDARFLDRISKMKYGEKADDSEINPASGSVKSGKVVKGKKRDGRPPITSFIDPLLFKGENTIEQIADMVAKQTGLSSKQLKTNVTVRFHHWKGKGKKAVKTEKGIVHIIQ